MRGSATLAIVLSSACMIEASITDKVMSTAMRHWRGRIFRRLQSALI